MADPIRYYERSDGTACRIVEHWTHKKVPDDDKYQGYRYVTDERYLTIEEWDGRRWTEVERLGDYMDPSDKPDS